MLIHEEAAAAGVTRIVVQIAGVVVPGEED
jgi:hypothetical protein